VTRYSLDTDTCIALLNGRPAQVRERFIAAQQAGDSFAVSAVVLFELRYGAAKSQHPEATSARLETFLEAPIEVLPLDAEDATDAGAARAALERAGTPIGAYDVVIAGQARRRDFTVVTSNIGEFGRVDRLSVKDWAH
jgi:tRNA(fMet)-specific endonuclease VapC